MAVSIISCFCVRGQQPETVIGQEIDRKTAVKVSSLDQLTYINNECKVRLTKDIVMTEGSCNGNSLTIDLNGHTLTAAANSQLQGGR